MDTEWRALFENCGIKKVTHTDRNKQAYVPNESQRRAIQAAGRFPSLVRPAPGFELNVLFDPEREVVEASYYNSERTGSGRPPETRMGHEFIRAWLKAGDTVLIGNVGAALFVAKVGSAQGSTAEIAGALAKSVDPVTIFAKASAAKGPPERRQVSRSDFARNPYVVAAALLRAKGSCEAPGCKAALFITDRGAPYLEVHHLTSLAEGGDDTLANVAALCPSCHRELHFGKARRVLRSRLLAVRAGPAGVS